MVFGTAITTSLYIFNTCTCTGHQYSNRRRRRKGQVQSCSNPTGMLGIQLSPSTSCRQRFVYWCALWVSYECNSPVINTQSSSVPSHARRMRGFSGFVRFAGCTIKYMHTHVYNLASHGIRGPHFAKENPPHLATSLWACACIHNMSMRGSLPILFKELAGLAQTYSVSFTQC